MLVPEARGHAGQSAPFAERIYAFVVPCISNVRFGLSPMNSEIQFDEDILRLPARCDGDRGLRHPHSILMRCDGPDLLNGGIVILYVCGQCGAECRFDRDKATKRILRIDIRYPPLNPTPAPKSKIGDLAKRFFEWVPLTWELFRSWLR